MEFVRARKTTRYLDPRSGFRDEVRIDSEIRQDPLTGRTGRVAHFVGFRVQPIELDPLVEASRAVCPFCPERVHEVTPRFPADLVPEGRLQRGEAVAFPNLSPYDEHSALVVISREHYLTPGAFTSGQLVDAHQVALDYFAAVRGSGAGSASESGAGSAGESGSGSAGERYPLIGWNYLPAAGSSQIHPHLQVYVTEHPGNTPADELTASARYYAEQQRPYWADLVDAEQQAGQRYIGRGQHSVWLTDFVSRGFLSDVLAVFPGRARMDDLDGDVLAEFATGLRHVLAWCEAENAHGFNMAWYAAPTPRDDFWLHVRISPHVFVSGPLHTTDTSVLNHLYGESLMVRPPEEAAAAIAAGFPLS
jgi:galactose-1-phosphate uridylyltransferase